MTTGEFGAGAVESKRVVEAEIRLPHLDKIVWPKVNLRPLGTAAGDVLLTGIGVGVLVVRGLVRATQEAHRAGREWAGEAGPSAHGLLDWLKGAPPVADTTTEQRHQVPVLPIGDYDQLTPAEIAAALATLDRQELGILHQYEREHQARQSVLNAIENRLATMG
jgi:hypothetical protein